MRFAVRHGLIFFLLGLDGLDVAVIWWVLFLFFFFFF